MAVIKNILVATDFSEHSGRAVDFAIGIARDSGADLHLVTVNDDAILNAPTTSDEFREQAAEKLREKLQAELDQRSCDGVNIHQAVLHGGAAHEIQRYVRDHSIDMIVIGKLGRSAVADMLLGSVALKLIKNVDIPVVSVR